MTVSAIDSTTRDAVVITLRTDDPETFEFTRGQYLTFRRFFDGEELRRSYSICSGEQDPSLQVAIKRVDGGVFSTWANTELAVGDQLDVMPPMGKFFRKEENAEKHHVLCFAAGSGITPILSILRTGLAEHSNTRFTLVFGNRSIHSIMFREELEDLKNENMGRLSVVHILSDQSQDIDLFSGRIDTEKCMTLFKAYIDLKGVDAAYICGPQAMITDVAQALTNSGFEEQKIRYELFNTVQSGRGRQRALSADTVSGEVNARTTLGGETRTFSMMRNVSLLEAALANRMDAPFACKAGVCSTCRAKVLEGNVEMVANHALEDYEVEAGYVLTCQCYALSDNVVWDYDQAAH